MEQNHLKYLKKDWKKKQQTPTTSKRTSYNHNRIDALKQWAHCSDKCINLYLGVNI